METELEIVSARNALDGFHLDTCIETLTKRLQAQLGGEKPNRTRSAKERATKLRAIVELL